MSYKRKWLLDMPVLLIICTISMTARSQSTSIDIKRAIETALANNYSLKADSMNMPVAGYRAGVAKADFLPQVNYNNKTEYNPAIPSQLLPGNIVGQPSKEYVPVQFGTSYAMGSGVEVSQAIIRKSSRVQVANAILNTHIAETKHMLTREDLVYQVATAYYQLQATGETISTTRKDHENIKEIAAIAKVQYVSGVLKRIDFETLQINAANIESQLNQLQTKYTEQLAWFKYLLGLPANASVTITNNITTIPDQVKGGGTHLWNRTDVFLYRQLIQSKELDIKSIQAEKSPTLNAYFRFNYQSQFNNAGDAFKNDYWFKTSTIGLSTSIPLFDGYRRKNRINIAQAELQQLKFRNELQQQLASTEWITASETLSNDRQQVQITRQNLAMAEKVYNARKALYAEGVTTLIELLDAERELSQSRNLYTQALISVQTSLVNAHKANGTLLTDFIKSI